MIGIENILKKRSKKDKQILRKSISLNKRRKSIKRVKESNKLIKRLLEEETKDVNRNRTNNNHKKMRKSKITKKERRNSLKNPNQALKKRTILKHKEKTIKALATLKSRRRILSDSNTNS
jgi:hypothetical protein